MNKYYLVVCCILWTLRFEPLESKSVSLNEWKHGVENTYYLVGLLPMSWDESVKWCLLQGGQIAEPRTAQETATIEELLEYRENYWIGMKY